MHRKPLYSIPFSKRMPNVYSIQYIIRDIGYHIFTRFLQSTTRHFFDVDEFDSVRD